jgi:hypothetical protein
VLGRACVPRHMLPYGKKDRPNYPGASRPARKRARAIGLCGLIPFDFPGNGLRCESVASDVRAAQAAGCDAASSRGSRNNVGS